MNITPIGNRVLIKIRKKQSVKSLASGIIVNTQYDKTEELHGDVKAVGKDVEQVKVGDVVSFPAYGYDSVSDNAEDFVCVREPEILAVINPQPVTE